MAEIFRDANNPIIWVKFTNPTAWEAKLSLQVDNRGGEFTEIFVGHMPQTIKANSKDDLFYPAPTVAENAVVRIGDKEVGTLWPDAEQPDWSKEEFFVDVTGKRSCEYREVYYSSQGFSVEAVELLKLKPVHGELSAKFLHHVPFSFSFFLERAPENIQVKASSTEVFEVRTEIVER